MTRQRRSALLRRRNPPVRMAGFVAEPIDHAVEEVADFLVSKRLEGGLIPACESFDLLGGGFDTGV